MGQQRNGTPGRGVSRDGLRQFVIKIDHETAEPVGGTAPDAQVAC